MLLKYKRFNVFEQDSTDNAVRLSCTSFSPKIDMLSDKVNVAFSILCG